MYITDFLNNDAKNIWPINLKHDMHQMNKKSYRFLRWSSYVFQSQWDQNDHQPRQALGGYHGSLILSSFTQCNTILDVIKFNLSYPLLIWPNLCDNGPCDICSNIIWVSHPLTLDIVWRYHSVVFVRGFHSAFGLNCMVVFPRVISLAGLLDQGILL